MLHPQTGCCNFAKTLDSKGYKKSVNTVKHKMCANVNRPSLRQMGLGLEITLAMELLAHQVTNQTVSTKQIMDSHICALCGLWLIADCYSNLALDYICALSHNLALIWTTALPPMMIVHKGIQCASFQYATPS